MPIEMAQMVKTVVLTTEITVFNILSETNREYNIWIGKKKLLKF